MLAERKRAGAARVSIGELGVFAQDEWPFDRTPADPRLDPGPC
jgi:hypothetical protein